MESPDNYHSEGFDSLVRNSTRLHHIIIKAPWFVVTLWYRAVFGRQALVVSPSRWSESINSIIMIRTLQVSAVFGEGRGGEWPLLSGLDSRELIVWLRLLLPVQCLLRVFLQFRSFPLPILLAAVRNCPFCQELRNDPKGIFQKKNTVVFVSLLGRGNWNSGSIWPRFQESARSTAKKYPKQWFPKGGTWILSVTPREAAEFFDY